MGQSVKFEFSKEAGLAVGLTLEEAGWPFTSRVVVDGTKPTSCLFGRVEVGDRILSVNGVEISSATEAANLLRSCSHVVLCVERRTPATCALNGNNTARGAVGRNESSSR
mmetsp:Transcript_1639/g.3623  ORF Transcript_1639/g.3623 Transcript_1639/m.3623 type:complete len:110 (-) Transcript_1639:605-934(-)